MNIETYPHSQYPTSILHIEPHNAHSAKLDSPLFVWIPGNPGLLEYYEEMLKMIHRNNPEWEILGISHAGMSPGNPLLGKGSKNTKIYTLEEQIEHKIEVVNNFSSPGRPILIMGHSVGAYIIQKVIISKRLIGRVIKLGMLTPTIIDIHTSEKGVLFTKLFRWVKNLPQLAAWGSDLLFNKIVPRFCIKPFLSFVMGCKRDSRAVDASSLLLHNSGFVMQALGLAQYEMEIIRSDWQFQRELLDLCRTEDISIWLLFGNSDHWVSDETRRQLIHFYQEVHVRPNISIQVSSVIPHSFVIDHSQYVVDNYF